MLQVTVVSLELASPTLPPGKELVMNLLDPAVLASMKKNPVTIKEGIEFKWGIPTFVSGSYGLTSFPACASTSRSTTPSSL